MGGASFGSPCIMTPRPTFEVQIETGLSFFINLVGHNRFKRIIFSHKYEKIGFTTCFGTNIVIPEIVPGYQLWFFYEVYHDTKLP